MLGVGAHTNPFDMAFICGGTLAKYAKRGHRVVMGSVCGGNTEEGDRVAAALGSETRYFDYKGGRLTGDIELAHRVVEMIREVRPDIVVTTHPSDFDNDHRVLSGVVLNACLKAVWKMSRPRIPPSRWGTFITATRFPR